MSDYTPTKNEILSATIAQGTQLATFTTEASLMGGLLLPQIPALYFLTNTSVGRTLRVRAAGKLGTTSAPTFTWFVRLIPHGTAWASNAVGMVLLGQTAALTAGTTQTLAPWFMDLDIVMTNVNQAATSALTCMGEVRSPLGLASPFAGTMPVNNSTSGQSVTTYDNNVTYDLYLSAACGTSSASNLINLQMVKLYGEN